MTCCRTWRARHPRASRLMPPSFHFGMDSLEALRSGGPAEINPDRQRPSHGCRTPNSACFNPHPLCGRVSRPVLSGRKARTLLKIHRGRTALESRPHKSAYTAEAPEEMAENQPWDGLARPCLMGAPLFEASKTLCGIRRDCGPAGIPGDSECILCYIHAKHGVRART